MFFKKKAKHGTRNSKVGGSAAAKAEPSFVSRECVIDGHLNCEGEIHVDGMVRGSVNAQICVIEASGVVQGEVSGDVVHVQGRVLGPIHGRNVYIYQGAHVEGEVLHDTISIENGAYLYGTVRHNAAPAPAVPPQPQANMFGSLFEKRGKSTAFENNATDGQQDAENSAEIKNFPNLRRST